MVFREEKLSDGMLKQLVSLSSDWEAELLRLSKK